MKASWAGYNRSQGSCAFKDACFSSDAETAPGDSLWQRCLLSQISACLRRCIDEVMRLYRWGCRCVIFQAHSSG